jgi:hypothetical protein
MIDFQRKKERKWKLWILHSGNGTVYVANVWYGISHNRIPGLKVLAGRDGHTIGPVYTDVHRTRYLQVSSAFLVPAL